jgi:hypothetical protein
LLNVAPAAVGYRHRHGAVAAQPLGFPPAEWQDGFALAYEPDEKIGRIAAQYRLGGNELYLLCRGAACAAQPADGLRK